MVKLNDWESTAVTIKVGVDGRPVYVVNYVTMFHAC